MAGPHEEEPPLVFMAEQAMRSLSEDLIGTLDEANSAAGQLHRIAITDSCFPSSTQMQYLIKAHTEIGKILEFFIDLTAAPRQDQ